jgi:hypothetical protein
MIQLLELAMAKALLPKKQAMTWNSGANPRQKRLQQELWLLQWQLPPGLQPLVLPHRPLLQPPKRKTLQPSLTYHILKTNY